VAVQFTRIFYFAEFVFRSSLSGSFHPHKQARFPRRFFLLFSRNQFVKVVQRVEIITGQQEFPQVLAALEACGVTGYAMLRNVLGKGDKKVYSFDSISGEVENLMIVTTIADDSLNKLIEALRPILKRYGGSCLVSDAMWVIH
jgi:nitrogen regulatory protein PII